MPETIRMKLGIKIMLPIFLSLSLSLLSLELKGQDFEGPQLTKLSQADSLQLQSAWETFVKAMEGRNTGLLQQISLSKVNCSMCFHEGYPYDYASGNYLVPVDTFINQAFKHMLGSQIWKSASRKPYSIVAYREPGMSHAQAPADEKGSFMLYHLFFTTYEPDEWAPGHEGQTHGFQFIKKEDDFKFYGLTSIP